jgi:hypothetical protein
MARLLGCSLDLDKVAAVAAKQFGDVFDRDLTINTSVDGA